MIRRKRKKKSWRKAYLKSLKPVGEKPTVKRGRMKQILDGLASMVVRKRDEYRCQKCYKEISGANAHCSHVIPKSAGDKLRWDLNNMKTLCYFHHLRWWHKNPLEASEWFKATFPDRWEYLEQNKGMAKFTDDELLEIKDKLERILFEKEKE